MKISVLLLISFFIFTTSNSFSTPLNGTYTIGSGGDYPTINSATVDAENQGINGPVTFNILSGIYNEFVSINYIPGSSSINTFTLKSQSGNSSDVEIGKLHITASNIVIMNLSINSPEGADISYGGDQHNVNIINNDFRNHELWVFVPSFNNTSKINVLGNINISNMDFSGEYWFSLSHVDSAQIKNNIINGSITFRFCRNFLIENNTIAGGIQSYGAEYFKFIKIK